MKIIIVGISDENKIFVILKILVVLGFHKQKYDICYVKNIGVRISQHITEKITRTAENKIPLTSSILKKHFVV